MMEPPNARVLIATNPATGEELGRVTATTPQAVREQVEAARRVQRADWSTRSWEERRAVLQRWKQVVARHADELAEVVRNEIGKPAVEAMGGEVVPTLDALRWTIRNAGRILKSRMVGPGPQRFLLMPSARIERRPVGVVAAIGAWNYPILLNAPVVAHALAAGNAVVWKPSEHSALCGDLLQRTLDAAGFPEGLVSIVQGGPETGEALIQSSIDFCIFTGGWKNGHKLLETLGGRGIRAVAELSGFDAAIVLPDVDRTAAVRALVWSAFINAGQTCAAMKRLYVVGSEAEARALAEAIAQAARSLRIGDPGHAEVDLGPMINQRARDRFHEQVQAAVAAGAECLTGGSPIEGPGFFYPPTVLLSEETNHEPEHALEGAFGPVLIVRPRADADRAASAVNSSRYGLTASVWSRDRHEARRIAERLEVGAVGINEGVTFFAHAGAPIGGVRASGHGRVHGAEGLLEFTRTRSVFERRHRSWRPQAFPAHPQLVRMLAAYRRFVHSR